MKQFLTYIVTIFSITVIAMSAALSIDVFAEGTDSPNDNLFYYTNADDNNRLHGFYMLDVTESSDSKFFILAKEAYLCMPYDLDRDMRFDPTKPNTIAYAINNGALESAVRNPYLDQYVENGVTKYVGTWQKFPPVVSNYADPNHVWTTEKTTWSTCTGAILEPYNTTARFALMSRTEFNQYYNNGLGFDAECCIGNTYPWIFRSSLGQNVASDPVRYMYGVKRGTPGVYQYVNNKANTFVRPVFYLSEDFFRNVHIDVSTMGKNVKSKLVNTYTVQELNHLYTVEELQAIGFNSVNEYDVIIENGVVGATGETLEGATSISATATVTNNTTQPLPAPYLIIALYNNQELANVKYSRYESDIPAGTSASATVILDQLSGITSQHKVKTFIWKDMNLTPLCSFKPLE